MMKKMVLCLKYCGICNIINLYNVVAARKVASIFPEVFIMKKRITALIFCLVLVFSLCSCKSDKDVISSDVTDGVSSVEEPKTVANPLTGLQIDASIKNVKPVAIMINNISVAQKVQTGLNSFDVIYETEVEGGITRMMGVAKNPAALPQVGSVRSARFPYLELALGHDATFVHGGFDPVYFAPHRKELKVKTIDINGNFKDENTGKSYATSKCGFRQANGLSSEHTLYTTGEKLAAGRAELGYETESTVEKWINFSEEAVTLSEPCLGVKVPFSGSYISSFNYDATLGKYIKTSSGTVRTDYITGEKLAVKNVFVLLTDIQPYPDNYHMEVELKSGEGYYISNGACEKITWTKGSTYSALSFKKADGTDLTANAGNSYICLLGNDQAGKLAFSAE